MKSKRNGSGFLPLVRRMEKLANRNKAFGTVYSHLFYRRMIAIECSEAGLEPGAAVVQIGCGHCPMTALALADQGFRVTAVDRDPAAIRDASARDTGGRITFIAADATELDYAGYDAVFVALHVEPRREVVERILATADGDTRILLRNPRGSLNGSYTRLHASDTTVCIGAAIRKLPGQKELLVIKSPGAGAACGVCSLCDLAPRQSGRIAHANVPPHLAAMGFRPGKDCTILAVQPWGGPVICTVAGRDVAVERNLARDIEVTPRPRTG